MEKQDQARHRRLLRRSIITQRRNKAANNTISRRSARFTQPICMPVVWPQCTMNAVQRPDQIQTRGWLD